ncbi:MAG: EamA family transporter [Thermodesulfobacteriota bacterium]|nr:EamA family transporter [Thermodesulfobacteriota bacterium]
MKAIWLALSASLITTVGQLVLKIGMNKLGPINSLMNNPINLLQVMIINPFTLTALFLYANGFIVWSIVLSKLDLSYAYPFLALAYILVPVSSWIILGEHIPMMRWVGILIICAGLIIVGCAK